jgi:hypothetical protein
MVKLNSLADANGVISTENLKRLTSDELKYLGTASTTDNKFSLSDLNIGKIGGLQINSDGTIQQIGGAGASPAIDIKTIALNKMGDELATSTGKESVNYNSLISLYGTKSGGQSDAEINIGDIPAGTKLEQKGNDWYYNGKKVKM